MTDHLMQEYSHPSNSTNTGNFQSSSDLLNQHGYSSALELIGEGSNGKTYKTRNMKTGQTVAVKELKFSENLKNYELFEREAETLKSLHTPGTPVFYEYITNQKEFTECWLVQEYIDGESILDKLEKGEKYDELKTLNLILQVADIIRMLQTLYAPAIIHRDIKPSNILIRNKPKDNMDVCLIDFGAVANPQRRGLNSTVAGTVGYMAPEQLVGDCSIQSDYYALGATALHMLSGIAPSDFPADGFKLHFKDYLLKSCPDIHRATIDLLDTLLAPHPEDRPKDAYALIHLIQNTIQHCRLYKGITASLNSETINKILLFYSNHKTLIISLSFILGTLLALGIMYNIPYLMAVANNEYQIFILFFALFVLTVFLFALIKQLLTPIQTAVFNAFPFMVDPPSIAEQPETLQFYEPSLPDAQATGSNKKYRETTCTISAVFVNTITHADIIEYTYSTGHKSYTAFHVLTKEQMAKHHYKEGDTFKLLYSQNGYFRPQI